MNKEDKAKIDSIVAGFDYAHLERCFHALDMKWEIDGVMRSPTAEEIEKTLRHRLEKYTGYVDECVSRNGDGDKQLIDDRCGIYIELTKRKHSPNKNYFVYFCFAYGQIVGKSPLRIRHEKALFKGTHEH